MSNTPDLDKAREAVQSVLAHLAWFNIEQVEIDIWAAAILKARVEETQHCLSKAPSRGDLKTMAWFRGRAEWLRRQAGIALTDEAVKTKP